MTVERAPAGSLATGGADEEIRTRAPFPQTANAPAGRALAREVAAFVVPALVVAAVLAAACACRHLFVGSIDNEQIFAQGHSLLWAWSTGESITNRAFLGLPTPYTYSPSLHEFSLPLLALSRITGPWFAFDFLLFSIFIANGASMYAMLRAAGLGRAAATLGGFLYLMAPTTIIHAHVDAYLGQTFCLPLMFWLLYRDRQDGFHAARWAAFGAAVAVLAGAHEYLGLMGLGLLAVALACNARRLGARHLAGAAAAALAVFVVIEAPVLWMYAEQRAFDRANGTVFARPLEHSVHNSCSPADYLLPYSSHPIYAGLSRYVTLPDNYDTASYIGFVNLVALCVFLAWALLRRNRLRAFLDESPFLRVLRCELWVAGVGALIATFGPRWKSAPWIMLPVELLRTIPPFPMVRGWGRFAIVVFFVLTVLTAHLVDYALRRWSGPGSRRLPTSAFATVALLLGFVVVDQLPAFFDSTYRVAFPTALETVRREPGDFLVLHLPLAWYSGPLHNGVAQTLQPFHGKRTVNGYAAFLPDRYYREAVLDTPLRALEIRAPHDPPVAPESLWSWLVERDVRFVIYERRTQGYYPPVFTEEDDVRLRFLTMRMLRVLTERRALDIIEDDDDYTVYRVQP